MALPGVALTATSFTWREHDHRPTRRRQKLSGLGSRDYQGAGLIDPSVPKLRMRPTAGPSRPADLDPGRLPAASSAASSTAPTAIMDAPRTGTGRSSHAELADRTGSASHAPLQGGDVPQIGCRCPAEEVR